MQHIHILQHILTLLINHQVIPPGLARRFAAFITGILTNPPPGVRPPGSPVI